jgi:hypothetical protein
MVFGAEEGTVNGGGRVAEEVSTVGRGREAGRNDTELEERCCVPKETMIAVVVLWWRRR